MKIKRIFLIGMFLTALLLVSGGCAASGPAPAQGAGKIVYEMRISDDVSDVYIINPDGSGKRAITQGTGWSGTPALSPDGTKIAFASDREGEPEIYVVNVDGSNLTRLTYDRASDFMPAWSPDGKKIAFISTRIYKAPLSGGSFEIETGMELYVMDADGSNVQRLSSNMDDQSAYPDWSPDGKNIVFMNILQIPTINVIAADGSARNSRPLFQRNDMAGWTPKWSPDGKYIYFMAESASGAREIYRMDADGKNTVNLTEKWNPVAVDPSVSPDGKQVVFASEEGDATNLYIMDVASRQVRQLTREPAGASLSRPSWGR